MKRCCYVGLSLVLALQTGLEAAKHSGPLTPIRTTKKAGAYTVETVGDASGQASPQNTRLIIRVSDADKKMIKPERIALVDKSGKAIEPVFREDRKVGNEENTGLPLTVGSQSNTSGGGTGLGVGVNLNKLLGPRGSYAYTKVDWPKSVFTADKKLQIVLPGGQAFVFPLTSLSK